MNYPSIKRLAELQLMIADFARVERVPHLADLGRPESDVEHSFGLALTCWYLHPKIAPELDLLEILKYALSHDIVEIHAGDTFAFSDDTSLINSKEQRERDAVETLRLDWDDFPELTNYTEGYMDKIREEAKFVKAVDKLLPLLMIDLGEGSNYWTRYGITIEKLKENKKPILLSSSVAPYYDLIFQWLRDNKTIDEY